MDRISRARNIAIAGFQPAKDAEPAKCGQCGATTADSCNSVGCGYLESGNGEPAKVPEVFVRCTDRLPEFLRGRRVVIYTDGYDFEGQQFFDVAADDLNKLFFPDDEQPENCQLASHWAYVEDVAALCTAPPPAAGEGEKIEFRCPECGGHRFGTSSTGGSWENAVGHCHSYKEDGSRCRFTWKRSTEDDRCFVASPSEDSALGVTLNYHHESRSFSRCMADDDGHCAGIGCPQLRDGEPHKTGRHCPLDTPPTEPKP